MKKGPQSKKRQKLTCVVNKQFSEVSTVLDETESQNEENAVDSSSGDDEFEENMEINDEVAFPQGGQETETAKPPSSSSGYDERSSRQMYELPAKSPKLPKKIMQIRIYKENQKIK
jgi:hypothetical protein